LFYKFLAAGEFHFSYLHNRKSILEFCAGQIPLILALKFEQKQGFFKKPFWAFLGLSIA